MKLKALVPAVALALAATAAHAGQFDANGGLAGQQINLAVLDWGPTSFLAQGGNTAIANFLSSGGTCAGTSCDFTVLTQARLIGTLPPGSLTPNTPSGLNNSYEITMVTTFTETVTDVDTVAGNAVATFTAVPTSGFINIYFDTATNSNQLTGHGFDDGQVILTGTLANASSGAFFVTSPIATPLDQFGANNYSPAQLTRPGFGSNESYTFQVTGQDAAFFIDPLQTFGLQIANISISLPFNSVDPMDCFTVTGRALGAVNAVSDCNNVHNGAGLLNPVDQPNVGAGYVPNVGPTNGLNVPGVPDFIAQTDFNSPVSFVPEPASLALLGIGLMGVGMQLRRKDKASA